jgi:F-type H+-transporting ATPase subunit gamma
VPSLKSIRSRIASVKNTQKITKAMKLVAAARLRRAQDALIAARPYAQALAEVISDVALRAGGLHPLLDDGRPEKRVELVVITSDRGLAGAFNTNLNRAVERYTIDNKDRLESIRIRVVGRKGRDYLRRRKHTIEKEYPGVASATALERARELTHEMIAGFTERKADAVYLVYNEFKSAITQTVRVERILPVVPKAAAASTTRTAGDFLYEPDKETLLRQILPLYVEIETYRALLETIASEFGSRMSAMDNATRNASEMIGKLTLQYNRARQAAITKELLEIIGGAEALKG